MLISLVDWSKENRNFLNILSKIEAHDSHLIILQRYSNTLESGVYSFDDLIVNPDYLEIQNELDEYENLARKTDEDDFRIISPIVVINPSSESDFSLEFQSIIFAKLGNLSLKMTYTTGILT